MWRPSDNSYSLRLTSHRSQRGGESKKDPILHHIGRRDVEVFQKKFLVDLGGVDRLLDNKLGPGCFKALDVHPVHAEPGLLLMEPQQHVAEHQRLSAVPWRFGWCTNWPAAHRRGRRTEDLTFRGNYSTSFVAPPLTILRDEYGAFGTAAWSAVSNNRRFRSRPIRC